MTKNLSVSLRVLRTYLLTTLDALTIQAEAGKLPSIAQFETLKDGLIQALNGYEIELQKESDEHVEKFDELD